MKARFSLLAMVLPFAVVSSARAATLTCDADLGITGAQDGSGTGWNTTARNVYWPNTSADEIIFGAGDSADGYGVIVTVVENDALPDSITVQIPRTLAIGNTLFARLQVTK